MCPLCGRFKIMPEGHTTILHSAFCILHLRKGDGVRRPFKKLLTDTQLGDQSTVTVDVLLCQIVQHVAALTNHHQQTTTGVVVMLVHTQVIGQLVDASGQNGDLNLGRTGIGLVQAAVLNASGLLFLQKDRH